MGTSRVTGGCSALTCLDPRLGERGFGSGVGGFDTGGLFEGPDVPRDVGGGSGVTQTTQSRGPSWTIINYSGITVDTTTHVSHFKVGIDVRSGSVRGVGPQ